MHPGIAVCACTLTVHPPRTKHLFPRPSLCSAQRHPRRGTDHTRGNPGRVGGGRNPCAASHRTGPKALPHEQPTGWVEEEEDQDVVGGLQIATARPKRDSESSLASHQRNPTFLAGDYVMLCLQLIKSSHLPPLHELSPIAPPQPSDEMPPSQTSKRTRPATKQRAHRKYNNCGADRQHNKRRARPRVCRAAR